MIPADGEHFAQYTREDGQHGTSQKVIAWANNGDAMVLGEAGLVPAQNLPGFQRIYRGVNASPIVGAIPGGGWLVDSLMDDGEWVTAPVLAWAVHADGTASPIDTDYAGETGDARAAERCYIYHPDHDDPEARKNIGAPPAPESPVEDLAG